MSITEFLTTREIAESITISPLIPGECHEWQVRRLYEEQVLDEPGRFAGRRAIHRDQVPHIIEVMRKRGWLPTPDLEAVS